MYTQEEYSKTSMFGAFLTGTVMGFIKYSNLNEQDKKTLARQLQWCYENSGEKMPDSVQKEIENVLSA